MFPLYPFNDKDKLLCSDCRAWWGDELEYNVTTVLDYCSQCRRHILCYKYLSKDVEKVKKEQFIANTPPLLPLDEIKKRLVKLSTELVTIVNEKNVNITICPVVPIKRRFEVSIQINISIPSEFTNELINEINFSERFNTRTLGYFEIGGDRSCFYIRNCDGHIETGLIKKYLDIHDNKIKELLDILEQKSQHHQSRKNKKTRKEEIKALKQKIKRLETETK